MSINMDDVRSLITRDEAETAAGLKKNPKDTGMLEHWPSDNGIASVEVSFPEGSITQSQKRKVKKYVELGIAASDIDAQKEFEDKQLEEEAEAEKDEYEKDIPDVYDKRGPLTEDEILNLVKKDRDAAVRQQNFIADRMVSAYNAYHAVIDEKYNQPGRSTIVSSDVMDTVEWMMPSIMRVFTAAQDVVIIRPVGGEDVSSAEQHQALINYQFNYKMDGFTRFYTWFKDALIFGIGVVKITWENFYDKKAFFYEEMTEEEFTALSTNRNMVVEEFEEYEKIEITIQKNAEGKDEEGKAVSTVFKNVSGFMKRITYAGPWLENIPVSSFFIEPGARSVHEANFVAYRVKRTMDYLRRMQREGVYHNVDKIIPNADGDDVEAETPIYDKIEKNYVRDLEGVADTTRSSGREEKWVWECWVKLDIDNDGLLEPLLVTFVDETLLRVEQNPFDHGEPPFETIVPIIDCHKLHGISITDLVIEFQRMKTALYRNVFDNLAFSVNNFFLVRRDSGTDYSALIHLKPGAVIFTDDVKEGIREIQPAALPNYIFNLFEYLDSSKENRTGITKYNQGLDSASLNKTASGVSAIMTASQQRIELIARLMAETGVKQLFRKIISLNQQFVTEKIVIRLFNKQLEITPDKLDGSFDLMVNVGISAGMKELQQSQMLNLLNILPSLAELGLVQPLHIYNVVSKLLESMGYKDINNFIQNPEVAQQGNATPPTAPDGRESPAKQQPNAGNMFGQLQAEPMSASPKQTSPINTSTLFQV